MWVTEEAAKPEGVKHGGAEVLNVEEEVNELEFPEEQLVCTWNS